MNKATRPPQAPSGPTVMLVLGMALATAWAVACNSQSETYAEPDAGSTTGIAGSGVAGSGIPSPSPAGRGGGLATGGTGGFGPGPAGAPGTGGAGSGGTGGAAGGGDTCTQKGIGVSCTANGDCKTGFCNTFASPRVCDLPQDKICKGNSDCGAGGVCCNVGFAGINACHCSASCPAGQTPVGGAGGGGTGGAGGGGGGGGTSGSCAGLPLNKACTTDADCGAGTLCSTLFRTCYKSCATANDCGAGGTCTPGNFGSYCTCSGGGAGGAAGGGGGGAGGQGGAAGAGGGESCTQRGIGASCTANGDCKTGFCNTFASPRVCDLPQDKICKGNSDCGAGGVCCNVGFAGINACHCSGSCPSGQTPVN